MNMVQHDWVENSQDYEAVLVCTNELPEVWEPEQITRAFGTFQFFDATTHGDDPSYRHNDTGTIVRYEDNVLAIDFGHGQAPLGEELADLFSALSSLGWRSAEVYHPAATISALLEDMGRAIPANLDFDLRSAQHSKPIEDSSAGQTLMTAASHVWSKSATPPVSNESTALADMIRDLGEEKPTTLGSPVLPGSITLIDDHDDQEDELVLGHHLNHHTEPAPVASNSYAHVSDDEIPIIPSLDDDQPAPYSSEAESHEAEDSFYVPSATPTNVVKELEHPPTAMFYSQPETEIIEDSIKHVEASPVIDLSADLVQDLLATKPAEMQLHENTLPKIIKLGNTLFLFDVPESGYISSQELDSALAANKISNESIIHIQPGLMNSPTRWDFLGELHVDFPWISEHLAQIISTSGHSTLSTVLKAVRHGNAVAGLRDVLTLCLNGHEAIELAISEYSAEALMLFKYEYSQGRAKKDIDQIIQTLSPIVFTNQGESFIDPAGSADGSIVDFTVRSFINSSVSTAIIIHQNTVEGSFISTIIRSLANIVMIHSSSRNFNGSDPSVIATSVNAPKLTNRPAPRESINKHVINLLSELTERLQDLETAEPA
jgi:hypothetical protein